MAERLIFHYHHRSTPLHRIDPRIKLFTLLAMTVMIFQMPQKVLLFIIPILALWALAAKTPVKLYRKELFFFALFAGVIFLARWWGTDTIWQAAQASMRFLAIVAGGLLLTDTTAPEDISLAVFWLAAPFGKKRAYEFSAKFALTLNFIPIIFDAAQEISEARKTRLDRSRKHPLRRIVSISSQLMHHIIDRAEDVSFALESRCFTPYVLHGSLAWKFTDTAAALMISGYLILAVIVVV